MQKCCDNQKSYKFVSKVSFDAKRVLKFLFKNKLAWPLFNSFMYFRIITGQYNKVKFSKPYEYKKMRLIKVLNILQEVSSLFTLSLIKIKKT